MSPVIRTEIVYRQINELANFDPEELHAFLSNFYQAEPVSLYPAGKKGRKPYRVQLHKLINALKKYGEALEIDDSNIATVELFRENIFDPVFTHGQTSHYFVNLKYYLENILFFLANEKLQANIPKPYIKTIISHMLSMLGHCAPGIFMHVQTAYGELYHRPTISYSLARLRKDLVHAYASYYIENKNISEGQEVHVYKAFAQYAQNQGWAILGGEQFKEVDDIYVIDHTGITDKAIIDFHNFFNQEYAPNIFRHMLEELFESLEKIAEQCELTFINKSKFNYQFKYQNRFYEAFEKFLQTWFEEPELSLGDYVSLADNDQQMTIACIELLQKIYRTLFQKQIEGKPYGNSTLYEFPDIEETVMFEYCSGQLYLLDAEYINKQLKSQAVDQFSPLLLDVLKRHGCWGLTLSNSIFKALRQHNITNFKQAILSEVDLSDYQGEDLELDGAILQKPVFNSRTKLRFIKNIAINKPTFADEKTPWQVFFQDNQLIGLIFLKSKDLIIGNEQLEALMYEADVKDFNLLKELAAKAIRNFYERLTDLISLLQDIPSEYHEFMLADALVIDDISIHEFKALMKLLQQKGQAMILKNLYLRCFLNTLIDSLSILQEVVFLTSPENLSLLFDKLGSSTITFDDPTAFTKILAYIPQDETVKKFLNLIKVEEKKLDAETFAKALKLLSEHNQLYFINNYSKKTLIQNIQQLTQIAQAATEYNLIEIFLELDWETISKSVEHPGLKFDEFLTLLRGLPKKPRKIFFEFLHESYEFNFIKTVPQLMSIIELTHKKYHADVLWRLNWQLFNQDVALKLTPPQINASLEHEPQCDIVIELLALLSALSEEARSLAVKEVIVIDSNWENWLAAVKKDYHYCVKTQQFANANGQMLEISCEALIAITNQFPKRLQKDFWHHLGSVSIKQEDDLVTLLKLLNDEQQIWLLESIKTPYCEDFAKFKAVLEALYPEQSLETLFCHLIIEQDKKTSNFGLALVRWINLKFVKNISELIERLSLLMEVQQNLLLRECSLVSIRPTQAEFSALLTMVTPRQRASLLTLIDKLEVNELTPGFVKQLKQLTGPERLALVNKIDWRNIILGLKPFGARQSNFWRHLKAISENQEYVVLLTLLKLLNSDQQTWLLESMGYESYGDDFEKFKEALAKLYPEQSIETLLKHLGEPTQDENTQEFGLALARWISLKFVKNKTDLFEKLKLLSKAQRGVLLQKLSLWSLTVNLAEFSDLMADAHEEYRDGLLNRINKLEISQLTTELVEQLELLTDSQRIMLREKIDWKHLAGNITDVEMLPISAEARYDFGMRWIHCKSWPEQLKDQLLDQLSSLTISMPIPSVDNFTHPEITAIYQPLVSYYEDRVKLGEYRLTTLFRAYSKEVPAAKHMFISWVGYRLAEIDQLEYDGDRKQKLEQLKELIMMVQQNSSTITNSKRLLQHTLKKAIAELLVELDNYINPKPQENSFSLSKGIFES